MTGRGRWAAEASVYVAAMAVVAAMGLSNLYYPFGPDQAVLTYGAKQMSHGAIYYVDYWDNKQPGLYWFYLLAGRLFGFSESRVHLLELIWMLSFAAVLMATLRGAFRLRWLSAFVPAASIGVYYGIASESELTQLEFLVAFPLFVFVLCLAWAQRKPRLIPVLYFASGLLAGVTVVFKLLLAALCVAVWLVALFYLWRGLRLSIVTLLVRAVLPASAGVVLVLGAVVLLYVHWGHLDALLWTAFVYPPKALAIAPLASKSRLLTAAGFFLSGTAPWALFALFAVGAWLRNDRDLMGALMLAWIVAGTGLFLIQRFSWWHYHTLLILLPVGFMAVVGIDRLCAWLNAGDRLGLVRQTAVAAIFAVTASAGLAGHLYRKALPLMSEMVLMHRDARTYQTKVGQEYRLMWKGTRFLRAPDALPGPVYAFGSAIVHAFTDRPSPHSIPGSAWAFLLPGQIDDILATLDRKQVPYIFIDRNDARLFRMRPRIAKYLQSKYTRLRRDDSGTWYVRRDLTGKQ